MSKPQSRRPGETRVRPGRLEAKREAIHTGAPAQPPAPEPDATAAPASEKKTYSFQTRVRLMDEARTAVMVSQSSPDGYRSLAAFITAAIEDKLAEAAERFNDGKPFEPFTGEFRAGRPFHS